MHYWVSCAINKGGQFSRLHLCRHTFASLWSDCLRFASLWCSNSHGVSCLLDSICLRKAYISICVCQVFVESSKAFNTLSKILLWIKPSYFQHGSSLSLENVCDSWCMHEAVVPPSKSTELPSSSAAVVPQSKSTEWCSSSAAVVPHKVNLTEYCSGSAAVVPHKVNLPSCEVAQRPLYHKVSPPRWGSAAPFHLDLWYFRHRTNKHVIYSEKLINQPTVEPFKSLKSTNSTKLLKKLLTWAHAFHWRLWWFTWNVWYWECCEPVFKHI